MEAHGEDAVADATADDHLGVIPCNKARIVFREEALIRGIKASRKGDANLSAVDVTGQHQIDAKFSVRFQKFGSVGQQDGYLVLNNRETLLFQSK